MSILAKLKSNTTIKESDILADSKFFTKKDMIPTEIPVVNLALSGRLDGGLTPGLTMWAGPSKHFKTAFSLLMAKAYLKNMKMLRYFFTTPNSVLRKVILLALIFPWTVFFILLSQMLSNSSLT